MIYQLSKSDEPIGRTKHASSDYVVAVAVGWSACGSAAGFLTVAWLLSQHQACQVAPPS